MVSPVTLLGVAILVAVNTAIAAVAARYFRLTLDTRWGPVVFTVLAVPVLYLITTIVVGGVLGLGRGAFAGAGALLTVTWAFPFFLGYSIDLFWMPSPEAG